MKGTTHTRAEAPGTADLYQTVAITLLEWYRGCCQRYMGWYAKCCQRCCKTHEL